MKMDEVITTIENERGAFFKILSETDGVKTDSQGVRVIYALRGLDFRLGVTINQKHLDACASFMDGEWIYFVSYQDPSTKEWDNIYSSRNTPEGLIELLFSQK